MSKKKHTQRKQHHKRKHSNNGMAALVLFVLIVAIAISLFVFQKSDETKDNAATEPQILNQSLIDETKKSGSLKSFSGEEFKNLYNTYAYPNTQYIAEDAVITGDVEADDIIRKTAEDRGYVRRSAPVLDTFVEVEPGMQLQERASQPWIDLKQAAEKENIQFFLTAAYRSANEQREIFLERAKAIDLTTDLIKSGLYDSQLNEIFATTAIPGYSRHHTGYTVDIGCGNEPAIAFEFTVCFEWLSAENYKNAKTHGWIPSYPEGGGLQGPEPETWEYVWVGVDAVTE